MAQIRLMDLTWVNVGDGRLEGGDGTRNPAGQLVQWSVVSFLNELTLDETADLLQLGEHRPEGQQKAVVALGFRLRELLGVEVGGVVDHMEL